MSAPQPAPPPAPAHSEKIEPIVWLLFAGIFGSVALMVLISKWSPNDGQTFQVLAGLATFFTGALGMRIKPASTASAAKPSDPTDLAPK